MTFNNIDEILPLGFCHLMYFKLEAWSPESKAEAWSGEKGAWSKELGARNNERGAVSNEQRVKQSPYFFRCLMKPVIILHSSSKFFLFKFICNIEQLISNLNRLFPDLKILKTKQFLLFTHFRRIHQFTINYLIHKMLIFLIL